MAFIQDPRLRQTWNQLSQTTETVTSDAAAGIWAFGHRYVQPCLSSLAGAVDSCTAICLGDREERARRARERDRGARGSRRSVGGGRGLLSRPEYSFDFYDDWEEDLFIAEQLAEDQDDDDGLLDRGAGAGSRRGGGILGGDWDRLLAGSGHRSRLGAGGGGIGGTGDVVDQPRRKRGMSYGTRGGVRRKVSGEEDPNVIPRTAPLGFLGRLPFKIMGSLRYKPSAANLREHPGGHGHHHHHHHHLGTERGDEQEPLLGSSNEEAATTGQKGKRPRSDTTNSGDTSSSYRSRGDLFPSDGEGDEDAVPLDDEFTVALERVDDRGSTKTRSSKGKRTDERGKDRDRNRDKGLSRTVSRTTISSANTPDETKWDSNPVSPVQELGYDGDGDGDNDDNEDDPQVPSLEDLRREEEQAEREEAEEIERRRRAASQLARERGLKTDDAYVPESVGEANGDAQDAECRRPPGRIGTEVAESAADDAGLEEVQEVKPPPSAATPEPAPPQTNKTDGELQAESTSVPTRPPRFGQ